MGSCCSYLFQQEQYRQITNESLLQHNNYSRPLKKYFAKYKKEYPHRYASLDIQVQKFNNLGVKLLQLPPDILTQAFLFLPIRDLASILPRVCKYISAISCHESFWKSVCELPSTFPNLSSKVAKTPASYRLLCLEHHFFFKGVCTTYFELKPRHTAKVAFIGAQRIGKTRLLKTYYELLSSGKKLPAEARDEETIGVDFGCVVFMEESVRLQIWDTGGNERFRYLLSNEIRAMDVIVFCFDLTDRASFELIKKSLLPLFSRQAIVRHTKQILLGLKADVVHENPSMRQVTASDAGELCKEFDFADYVEASAWAGYNIKHLFETVIVHNALKSLEMQQV